MKVVIAFHACLLILHTNLEGCYDELDIILIYPSPMVLKNVSSTGGIFTKSDFLIEGQSAGGTVVISWHDAKKDAYHPHHENVLLHEFAHELDFMEGAVDGTPLLEYSKYHEWGIILSKEFRKLQNVALKNRNWGKYHEIGAYAATNEAEFFAVITERFFEDKKSFAKKFPDLYKELYNFYYSTLKKY